MTLQPWEYANLPPTQYDDSSDASNNYVSTAFGSVTGTQSHDTLDDAVSRVSDVLAQGGSITVTPTPGS